MRFVGYVCKLFAFMGLWHYFSVSFVVSSRFLFIYLALFLSMHLFLLRNAKYKMWLIQAIVNKFWHSTAGVTKYLPARSRMQQLEKHRTRRGKRKKIELATGQEPNAICGQWQFPASSILLRKYTRRRKKIKENNLKDSCIQWSTHKHIVLGIWYNFTALPILVYSLPLARRLLCSFHCFFVPRVLRVRFAHLPRLC